MIHYLADWRFMHVGQCLALLCLTFAASLTLCTFILLLNYYLLGGHKKLEKCCLYTGRVQHSRLKGGAMHHIDYPLFFAYIDLEEVRSIGWSLWPIFKLNGGWLSFCSLDENDHLKNHQEVTADCCLKDRVKSFVAEKSNNKLKSEGDITLMTHLTYFGYCFNPVSFYFINEKKQQHDSTAATVAATTTSSQPQQYTTTDTIIAEVSNTPWIEQHSYVLNECIPNVAIKRDNKHMATTTASVDTNNEEKKQQQANNNSPTFTAEWRKEFHVSPFMEMDYKYQFTFSVPPSETVAVQAKMFKLSTNELYFIANFKLHRMSFTPLNLLYVLVFYPFHTRIIQIWIHYEAALIFLKGVPFYEHPNGTDVDFGFGITGERVKSVFAVLLAPFFMVCSGVSGMLGLSKVDTPAAAVSSVETGKNK